MSSFAGELRSSVLPGGGDMAMNAGQIYRCQNIRCRSEMQVIEVSAIAQQKTRNPRCSCGAEMKKPYAPPVFRELPMEAKVLAGARADAD